MTDESKCKCGEPHDGWPSEDGSELCQMCWEAECGKSWWAMVNGLIPISRRIQQAAQEGK